MNKKAIADNLYSHCGGPPDCCFSNQQAVYFPSSCYSREEIQFFPSQSHLRFYSSRLRLPLPDILDIIIHKGTVSRERKENVYPISKCRHNGAGLLPSVYRVKMALFFQTKYARKLNNCIALLTGKYCFFCAFSLE